VRAGDGAVATNAAPMAIPPFRNRRRVDSGVDGMHTSLWGSARPQRLHRQTGTF
jgi:hypothetical protein